MRRVVSLAVLLTIATLFLSAFAVRTVAQAGPEHQRLGQWLGEWTYVIGDGSGTMSFEWFGDFFVRASEVTPTGANVLHVMGYDAEEEVYTWHRYWSNGYSDAAKGWLHEDTWTFVFDVAAGRRNKMTVTAESPDDLVFKWERSVEGGPWEALSEGRTTRVR